MRTTDTGGDSNGVVSPSCIEILRGCDGQDGLPGSDGKDGELGEQGQQGEQGEKGDPGTQATSVCRAYQELMGEMVHQEEMEQMELMGETVRQDWMEEMEWMEIPGHKALVVCRVHLASLPRVEWSTHAGGGPRVRVDREQSWSTAEELQGVTIPKEGLPTTSACQRTHSTPAMHLACRA